MNPKIRFKLLAGDWIKIPFNEPTCRQRGIRIFDGLKKRGWDASEWDGTEQCDLIIAQYNPHYIPLCRPACDYLVFDCNDVVFLHNHVHMPTFFEHIQSVDYVITGSTRICSHMRRIVSPLHCSYMPECIDPLYDAVKRASISGRILWMGGSDNIAYAAEADYALEKLSKKYDLTVVYVCPERQGSGVRNADVAAAKPFKTEWVQWAPESMIAEMGKAEIALAPVHQNDWCQCKSPNKMASFCGVGIPSVGSDIESYREFIQGGVNGFLAFSPEDWEEPLDLLLSSEELRVSIGAAGKIAARKRYDLAVVLDEYEIIIKRMVGINE